YNGVLCSDYSVAKCRARADRRTLPANRPLQPGACLYPNAVIDDARPDDRYAFVDTHGGADANRPLDSHVGRQCRRLVDTVRLRLRNPYDAAHNVETGAAVFVGRSDVGPISAACIESEEPLAGGLQRGKNLLAEIVELVRRNMIEDFRRKKIDASINELAAFGSFRGFFLKPDDLAALVEHDDAVLIDFIALD